MTPPKAVEVKPAAETKPAATGIVFVDDFATAQKQAEEKKLKLFVVFSTSWCGPCKKLAAEVWSLDSVARRVAKDFVPVYVDGDKDKATCRKYEVNAYPTIILANADGSLIAKEVGTGGRFTGEAWIDWIDRQLGTGDRLGDLIKAANANPADVAAQRAVADALYAAGRKKEAAEYYARAEKVLEDELLLIKLRKAEAMMDRAKSSPEVAELLNEVIPKLIAKKDERVVEITLNFANQIGRLAGKDNDPRRARQMMLDLMAAFPEHKQMVVFRCNAGMYAHQSGDNETALAEMRKIAEDYKDSTDEVTKIWVDRCERFIKAVEGGHKYR
ncbi:MAG: thioredoxin family protein [Planctomycetes bacterium]|nr:thioredoxin family protein [Planctomycetota bacterium]